MLKHWFWNMMSAAVIIWYSTITVYVGIRGWKDIKTMLWQPGQAQGRRMSLAPEPGGVRSIQAIDVHGHVGRYKGCPLEVIDGFYSGGPEDVLRRAERARVEFTFVSPLQGLFTQFGDDPVRANAELAADIGRYPGLFQWAVVDPTRPETFGQAAEIMKTPRCIGIKVHPDFHGFAIKEHGDKIFEFAAAQGAVILSHSGGAPSLPPDFLPFADRFPEVTFILAHSAGASTAT